MFVLNDKYNSFSEIYLPVREHKLFIGLGGY